MARHDEAGLGVVVELWLRPWAFFAPDRRLPCPPGKVQVPPRHDAPLLLFANGNRPPAVDGRHETVQVLARTEAAGDSVLSLLPVPVRRSSPQSVAVPGGRADLVWADSLDRPRGDAAPANDQERAARDLNLRARAVWDRISDVDELLADPARLWTALRARWTGADAAEPQMDVIVRHARDLDRTMDVLLTRPRRILRRVHRQVPLARVQEVDRRSMLWLARQPGETLAERAGDAQRILAVAREENYDTLENRVLRAYGELAARSARSYLDRNRTRGTSRRAVAVARFEKKSLRVARDLAAKGVRTAEAGVTPNFVLQQNAEYHAVWNGWLELLDEQRKADELWRWQTRSWEEYCLLALMVALAGLPDARPVATAPIWYRDEHHRGRWIEADAPLGVMYLPRAGLIVELLFAPPRGKTQHFGAVAWLRVGRVGDTLGFLSHVPVWPIWSPRPGLSPGEAAEVAGVVSESRETLVRGGLVIRPAKPAGSSEVDRSGDVLVVTIGTEGPALRDALTHLTDHLVELFKAASA